ncbi:reverse transcriptase [Salinicoccus cyprini]|uniref:Reverse transcriptase n=1 Tax=Salinicoccus cyprini TaxID=2493691 RepID=A0A558ARC9_9STAP|nr:reverse transcriptase domain-containing protein [Salinicoccus cyprini]TVT26808.1 reverse transcriptase [Salinicoccus cyprini]
MKQSDGPRQSHDLSSSSNINWDKYEIKGYLHFDEQISIRHMKHKLQNEKWVSSYAFWPFIHFKLNFKKYIKVNEFDDQGNSIKKKEKKTRNIYYAAHKDGYIYKYYGDMLNNAYNSYAYKQKFDKNIIAYRNNKIGKNNIDFAYEVFEHLFKFDNAVVISIDFTKYFDNIVHRTLKRNLCRVLEVESLSDDWYRVYKNLTKYSWVNKEDLDEFLEKKYRSKLKKKIKTRKIKRIMSPIEFREIKEQKLVYYNKNKYGIPQGSSMSAVCSNVHLIDFDEELKKWCENKSGNAMYRRYCDDLIIVVPVEKKEDSLQEIKDELLCIIEKYKKDGLEVQEEKTEIRFWDGKSVMDESFKPSSLDYLGFVTDGKMIQLREKSLFNYYTRAYRKAKTVKRIEYATNRPGPKKDLYDLYTHLGFQYKGYGNFIKYANKAHKRMSKLPVKSVIQKQIKRHWRKIHKRI